MTRWGLFGFLAATAAACGVWAASAHAQDTPRKQTGSWTIARIAGSNMCSMKNTWADGRKFVFARDTAGVNSVAVEFGVAKLEAGRQYPMTLDLPPVLTREAIAVAATPGVLLVGMGKDRAFYDALARMQSIYVTALGQEHGYDLSGSADALRELDDCAARLAGKTPPARVAVKQEKPRKAAPKVAAAAPSSGALSGQVAALEKKLAAAVAEKERLAEQAAAAAQAEAEARALKKKLAAARNAQASADAALEEKLAQVESERDALKRKVAAAQDVRETGAFLEERLAKLESERNALHDKLAAAKAQQKAAAGSAEEKEALAKRVSGLEEQLVAEARRARAAEEARARLEAELAEARAARKTVTTTARAAAPAAIAAAPQVESRLEKILGASGVVPPQAISARDIGGARLYQWRSGDILGSAEEMGSAEGGNFRARVAAWIDRMSESCRDDFAHAEAAPRVKSGVTVQTAEAACIGDTQSAAAALVFIDDGRHFSAIMHEAATEGMPAALAQRDRLAALAQAGR